VTVHSPSVARILPLPPLVASQIAAGEVVERPASVVKELVENALDAGSTRVLLELEQGGIELVRVSDDGRGIVPEDLPLALAAHATSKISHTSDLDRIATLGFRGEALASIASVSRLSIRSRTPEAEGASQLDAEGDRAGAVRPAAGPVGTVVTVRNLFFNTPARRKFLRTVGTEQDRCLEAFKSLAMAHPAVGFEARVDGRVVLDMPADQSPSVRAVAILGAELREQLVPVSADRFDDARGLTLWGLAGLPAIARGSTRVQHLFVNGRSVRDRTVQHAIGEAYRGLIEPGRYATVVLMLEMSPEGVDVNVHPQKAEVRFRDSGLVHSVVLGSLRRALAEADLTPSASDLRPGLGGGLGVLRPASPAEVLPMPEAPAVDAGTAARSFVEFFTRRQQGGGRFDYQMVRAAMQAAGEGAPGHEPVGAPGVAGRAPAACSEADGAEASRPQDPSLTLRAREGSQERARLLQVHNSYVVTQDEQGVVIIDQHALHERVMFEYLVARIAEGSLESQRLLTPALVQSHEASVSRLAELEPLLTRIGVEAAPVGPRTIAVHAFPTFLFDRGVDPVDFLEGLLAKRERGELNPAGPGGAGGAGEEALREVLDMMACKAAVKAGDRLGEVELAELVRLRDAVERSSNCPHGRPTSVRLTLRELEKLFGRS
jgi:DNA mismatch repair protein MutL